MLDNVIAATPYARTLAEEKKIDLATVPATGKHGEVKGRDVEAAAAAAPKASPLAAAIAADKGINLAGVIRILDLQGRLDERDAELDDLHKRVRRLADRVHELETRESVNSLVRVSDMPPSFLRLP